MCIIVTNPYPICFSVAPGIHRYLSIITTCPSQVKERQNNCLWDRSCAQAKSIQTRYCS